MSERRAPNPEQQQAISFNDGPLRIMAGAGTGKTHTLTQRIARLAADGRARPSELLALTFTTKAAEELAERVATAFDDGDDPTRERVDVDTYHAFGGRVVAEFGRLLDLPPEPIVLTPPEAWILLWRSLEEIDFQHIDLTHLRGNLFQPSPLYKMINLGSRLSDELRSLEDLDAYLAGAPQDDRSHELRDIARGLATYRARKHAVGAIDYGDQIELACELLARTEVAEVYRARYRYLLVDEFQDTNYSQSVLVRLLTGDPTGNVCVVGDPNQAIYGFRGAAPDNLDRFAAQEFPAAQTIALYQNFRSTQAILDVANRIWDDAPGDYRGNLVSTNENHGERPRLVTCDALADETAFIADEIGRLVAVGRTYDQIMILVRKNAMKQKLFRALRGRRIPVEAVGGTSLYETAEVRELISYLRVIGDPADDPSFAHVLCAEPWGLDEQALYRIARERAHGESLIVAARRLATESSAPAALGSCLEALAELTARAYRIGLRRLIDEIVGLRKGGYDEMERANISAFTDVVRRFAESRVERPDLRDLLAYIDLMFAAGPEEEAALEESLGDRNTVKIMTAHGAKGLESPIVFVAGANRNDFYNTRVRPDVLPPELAHPAEGQPRSAEFASERDYDAAIKAWRKEQQDLEERRVLYVALTRAQEQLYITWSRTDPSRKKPTTLLPALAPAVELCVSIAAPSAADAEPASPVFRQIAPRLLGSASGALESSAGAIAETLAATWRQNGGNHAVLESAAEAFVGERERTREQIAIIQAVERRQGVEELASTAGHRIISYSQLETHRACPHRYYLRYVAGLPGFPDRRAAAIGTAFHVAVATEAQRRSDGATIAPEQVQGWFAAEMARDPLAGAAPTNGAGGGGDPITAYLASPDAAAEPLLVEAEFSLRLGDAILNGVIDRVHRLPGGEIEVVDYKTDRQSRTAEAVKAGWQLPLYLIACQEVFPHIQPAPSRATMFFVRSNQRVTVEYSDAELATVRRELTEYAAEVQAVRAADHRASPGVCTWCEYRQICRYAVTSA